MGMGQGFDTKFEAFLFAGSNLDGAVLYALFLSVYITGWKSNLPPVFFMHICTAGIRIRHAPLFQPIRIIFGTYDSRFKTNTHPFHPSIHNDSSYCI
jgi:hypothetical protein